MNDLINERQSLDLLERTYDIVRGNSVGSSININPTFLAQEEGYVIEVDSNISWIASPITHLPPHHSLFLSPLTSDDYYTTPSSVKLSEFSGSYQIYKDQEPKKGTPEYIKSIIGDKAFAMLNKSDKDFLINSAGIFDLGKNVDIEGMLKRLNDE